MNAQTGLIGTFLVSTGAGLSNLMAPCHTQASKRVLLFGNASNKLIYDISLTHSGLTASQFCFSLLYTRSNLMGYVLREAHCAT